MFANIKLSVAACDRIELMKNDFLSWWKYIFRWQWIVLPSFSFSFSFHLQCFHIVAINAFGKMLAFDKVSKDHILIAREAVPSDAMGVCWMMEHARLEDPRYFNLNFQINLFQKRFFKQKLSKMTWNSKATIYFLYSSYVQLTVDLVTFSDVIAQSRVFNIQRFNRLVQR